MKTEIVNGNVVVINETREEAIETLNSYFEDMGVEPLSEKELKDWNIVGGETNSELQNWVKDYVSELHTNKCENKNAYRYEL